MSRKIFTAIWGAALAVFAASLVFIMGVSYNYFTGVQMKQLHAETALAAQGVSLCGKDYFTGLSTGDYRVTWIDADGTVLFDTGADASRMETISSARRSVRRSRTARARRAATPPRLPTASFTPRSVCRTGRCSVSRSCSSRSGRLCSGLRSRSALWRCSRLGSRSCSPRGSQKNRRAHQCH